ncbi:MAG: rhodanese-like domain-containing protein [Salinirussus sp.]
MVGEIDPDTLQERLEGEDAPLLVDIRPRSAFDESHLPGSVNVPLAEIPGSIDEIASADEVVTICPHGMASVKAARIVEAYQDFDGTVSSLAGGLEAWDGPMDSSGDNVEPEAPF